jgi:hypothetical protein
MGIKGSPPPKAAGSGQVNLFASQNERNENESSFGNADEDEGGSENDAHGAGVASHGLGSACSDRTDADGGATGGKTDFNR